MPGQCYGCGTEFGVFKKEHGCKNCGFAFCNKCLNEKSIPVPKKNNSKHHVCHKCFKILTGAAAPDTDRQASYDLPEAYLKRMAALKEREAEGHSSHSSHTPKDGGQKVPAHLRKLDKADRDIAMRLEKLKEDNKPKDKVSDAELNARLAQLKGQTYVPDKKPVYQPPDRRPEAQQVDDLMEQLAAEVDIDSLRPDPAQEVEARLAQLRQKDVPGSGAAAKPAIDSNNLNQQDKFGTDANNLNKVGKMGIMGQPLNPNNRNIKTAGAGSTASGDDNIDMEEMQRLMAEAAKDLELDAQRAIEGMQMDKELMDRLREVQKRNEEKKISNDPSAADSETDNTAQSSGALKMPETADDSDNEEDEETAAKKIIQRYLEEVKIDKAVGDSNSSPRQSYSSSGDTKEEKKKKKNKKTDKAPSTEAGETKSTKKSSSQEEVDSDYDDSDELPYCCICTEDATIRCRDCDLDLYCHRCFQECHAEMGFTDHRTTPYKAPKGYR